MLALSDHVQDSVGRHEVPVGRPGITSFQDLGWGAEVSQNLGHQKNSGLSERFGKVQVGGVPKARGSSDISGSTISRGWMLPGTLATCVGGNRRHPQANMAGQGL